MAKGEPGTDFGDGLRPPGEPVNFVGDVSLSGANAGGGFAGDGLYITEMVFRDWQLLAINWGDIGRS